MRKPIQSRFLLSLAAAGICCAGIASAKPIINVGINPIAGNSADQLVYIYVSDLATASVEDIEAEDISVQIANGLGSAPSITSVDLLTATIFAGNNSGQFPGSGNFPQSNFESTYSATMGNYVSATGLLATIHINTLGVTSGTFALSLGAGSTRQGSSDFLNGVGDAVPATFTDGTIVVPEPASCGLLAIAATAILRGGDAPKT